MKDLLIVGENPYAISGNAKMMRYILNTVDTSQFRIHLFNVDLSQSDPVKLLERPFPFPAVSSLNFKDTGPEEPLGKRKLLEIISRKKLDALLFVGLDIWQYSEIFQQINDISKKNKFSWLVLFPYDQQEVRDDWVDWLNMVDMPCVYSKFGFNLIKDKVERLKYFRPIIGNPNPFVPMPGRKAELRKKWFPFVEKDAFMFGFFGMNQFRKEPHKLIKAMSLLLKDEEVLKKQSDLKLYLHTNDQTGTHNLTQVVLDCGFKGIDAKNKKSWPFILKDQNNWHTDINMAELMNCMDCFLNCSMQEGLSWTVIEAMRCGIPSIVSHSTSHIELLEGTENIGVPCDEVAMIPLKGVAGGSFMDAKACKVEDIYVAMKKAVLDDDLRKRMGESGPPKIKAWEKDKSDINDFINMAIDEKKERLKPVAIEEKILFAQHSSAGDILMTTKCLKGLKERHPGIPLVYMTQKKYMDIVTENPYVDEIVEYDEKDFVKYKYYYNPHKERILPAGWGRNSNNLLTEFYWKILGVPENDFVITPSRPDGETASDSVYINCLEVGEVESPVIVHSTGGDPQFRTYKYLSDVCSFLHKKGYNTVQVGSKDDYPAGAQVDLRGKLSFRETAWIMSKAKFAVTVDSFISHLAGAFGISQVALFGSGNAHVVRPFQVEGMLICRSPDYTNCLVLGPCSAANRGCALPCTSWHDPQDIIKDIREIETYLKIHPELDPKVIFKHPDDEYEKVNRVYEGGNNE